MAVLDPTHYIHSGLNLDGLQFGLLQASFPFDLKMVSFLSNDLYSPGLRSFNLKSFILLAITSDLLCQIV